MIANRPVAELPLALREPDPPPEPPPAPVTTEPVDEDQGLFAVSKQTRSDTPPVADLLLPTIARQPVRRASCRPLLAWRDLYQAPHEVAPLLQRPRVLMLAASIAFGLSPFVAALFMSLSATQGAQAPEVQPSATGGAAADPAPKVTVEVKFGLKPIAVPTTVRPLVPTVASSLSDPAAKAVGGG